MLVRSSGDASCTLSSFRIESRVLRVSAEYPLAKADPREKWSDQAALLLLDPFAALEDSDDEERAVGSPLAAVGRREQRCRICRMVLIDRAIGSLARE